MQDVLPLADETTNTAQTTPSQLPQSDSDQDGTEAQSRQAGGAVNPLPTDESESDSSESYKYYDETNENTSNAQIPEAFFDENSTGMPNLQAEESANEDPTDQTLDNKLQEENSDQNILALQNFKIDESEVDTSDSDEYYEVTNENTLNAQNFLIDESRSDTSDSDKYYEETVENTSNAQIQSADNQNAQTKPAIINNNEYRMNVHQQLQLESENVWDKLEEMYNENQSHDDQILAI